ncbi:MAG: DUF2326 domain-containing protein [Magnetococcales bacterium]|nr:DUF2326 domain-containing protein [Magnetococcales bacterium]
MITQIYANDHRFRKLAFTEGFNIVLADRTTVSSGKDSRNGLGKTTLIQIIHFCLGANIDAAQKKVLPKKHLADWTFSLEISIDNKPVTITRGIDSYSNIYVYDVSPLWPIQPTARKGNLVYLASELNLLLGDLLFGLPIEQKGQSKRASFRSMISYFIRRGKGAYLTPFESYGKQTKQDAMLTNAFLLGLAWEYVGELEVIKKREEDINVLKKAIDGGIVQGFKTTLGELESQRVRIESQIEREEIEISQFRVHPKYEELQNNADKLTKEVHDLMNSNNMDQQFLVLYEGNLQDETPPQNDALVRIYEEAGIALPGIALRKIEEVKKFHAQIIANRHDFLADEIERIKLSISQREKSIQEKTEIRANIMRTLQAHGALNEYNRLQQQHMKAVNELNEVISMIENQRAFVTGQSQLKIDREKLHQKWRIDHDERKTVREKAISLFNEYSQYLYEVPGDLVVNVESKGYLFDVEIERSESDGIGNMKIFCYDLMLASLWAEHEKTPRVLIHDSLMFDGVDERQRARALELACRESEKRGFQYICTMNSDMVPHDEFCSNFDINQYVRLRLTDNDVSGSLLGMRF